MEGMVFKIQRFCIDDGPGIRTTVFLKGCPLHCLWCHNPESQSFETQLMYNDDLCVNCGKCISLCPNNCHSFIDNLHVLERKNCISCGCCLSPACAALSLTGYIIDSNKIIEEVLKDKEFYDSSGGGITLSGGEPLAQYDFTKDVLQKAKSNGIHTCIETCGLLDGDKLGEIIPLVDLFLIDYKETDSKKHKEFTGIENVKIIENIKRIDSEGGRIVLRCPIIPGYNANDSHFSGIAKIASSLKNIERIELEPYHNFGIDKYKHLEVEYFCKNTRLPEDAEKEDWVNLIKSFTDVPVKCF